MVNIINQFGQVKVGFRSPQVVSSVDTDAQAFITAASITDTTQQSAINTLVTQLKTYGIWTKMKALYPFVGGTASSHKWNLKDPRDLDAAYRLVFNGGGTHDATGYKGNVNGYANTFLAPQTAGILQNSLHVSFYAKENIITSGRFYLGGNAPRVHIQTTKFAINELTETTFSLTANTGLMLASRIEANSAKLYRNGSLVVSSTTSSSGNFNLPIFIMNRNSNGTVGTVGEYYQGTSAFASIGDGLTDAEAANFYTAVQTFQTTLGRQVGVPIVADTDAQAFLNAAVITNQTQANAINTLVTQLKTYGIWTKMKALYPFIGGTASSHKWNLKDPRDLDAAYRLVFTGGWTHSSTGALPNGTNAWADTKLTPSDVQTLNSNGMGMYLGTLNTATASDPIHMGVIQTASQKSSLSINKANTNISSGLNGTTVVSSTINPLGLISSHKTSSTLTTIYKNSTNVGSGNSGGSLPTIRIAFGNVSVNASAFILYGSGWTNSEHRLTYISDGLDSTDMANFYTAVQTFQTTLGRQVGVPIVADTDAQAFLDAAVITNQTQANAVNTLVTSLKSANIWTKMKAIYPFVGGTSAQHRFNLKDPRTVNEAFYLTPYGGLSHDSSGVVFNGSNAWFDTNMNAFSNLAVDNLHLSFYSLTNHANTYSGGEIGHVGYNSWTTPPQDPSKTIGFRIRNAGFDSTAYISSGNLSSSYSTTDGQGLTIGSVTNSTTYKMFKGRGSQGFQLKATSTGTNTGTLPSFNISIGKLQGYGEWSRQTSSFVSIGNGLTDSEATAFYNAVQAYQTTLGRQI